MKKPVMIALLFVEDEAKQAMTNGDGSVPEALSHELVGNILRNAVRSLESVGRPVAIHPSVLKAAETSSDSTIRLKETELRVIHLIAEGKSNKEIGLALHFAAGTVRNIISELLSKYELNDRSHLVSFAYKNKLIA